MARSTKGLYKRNAIWWMTYCDALGTQRFESCKTSNKKDAEKRLVDRRKEAQEGMLPAAPIKPLSLDELQQRTTTLWGINGAWRPADSLCPVHTGVGESADPFLDGRSVGPVPGTPSW